MNLIKELTALKEGKKSGYLSVYSPAVDFDYIQIHVTKDEAEADRIAEEWYEEADDTDAYVTNEKTFNGYHVIVMSDNDLDTDPVIYAAYADTEAECKAETQRLIDEEMIMGLDNAEDPDLIYVEV